VPLAKASATAWDTALPAVRAAVQHTASSSARAWNSVHKGRGHMCAVQQWSQRHWQRHQPQHGTLHCLQ
jgi:hypothetical protein